MVSSICTVQEHRELRPGLAFHPQVLLLWSYVCPLDPVSKRSYHFSKQSHQLVTKCSNTKACGGYFTSKPLQGHTQDNVECYNIESSSFAVESLWTVVLAAIVLLIIIIIFIINILTQSLGLSWNLLCSPRLLQLSYQSCVYM